MRMILKTLRRTVEMRKAAMFALAALMCALVSSQYAKMEGINNSNFVLMALCGGLAWKYNLPILFSIWLIPAVMVAYNNGVAVENEYGLYRYIAPRYGRRCAWPFCEICCTIIRGVGFAALLLGIGILVGTLNGKQDGVSLPSFISEAEAEMLCENGISFAGKLFVMTALRFSTIGLIVLAAHILPRHGTQAGFAVVLTNEVISFFNTTSWVPIFTFYSASKAGWSLSAMVAFGALGLAVIIGIYSALFGKAARNAMI